MDFFSQAAWTFTTGLVVLFLFGWYFATEYPKRKRNLGTALTVILTAFALQVLLPIEKNITLGLDLKGGTSFLLQLSPPERASDDPNVELSTAAITSSMLDQAVGVIEKRVNALGGTEPLIAPTGSDRILVQIPGLDAERIAEARENLQKVAKLEFRMAYPDSDRRLAEIAAGTNIIPPGYRVVEIFEEVAEDPTRPDELTQRVRERLLIKQRADIDGDRVAAAFARYGAEGWEISLRFDGKGAQQFGELTAQNVRNRMAIVLDGEVVSAPVIQQPIYGGEARISGRFTETEARNLASVLENPLRNPVQIIDERTVSATLGEDSVRSGFYAGLIGLAGTLLTVLLYYRFPGIIANLALVLNLVLLLAAMALFQFTLTLPGIAGIVLSIGMAVDANVLIYERLREELRAGKTLQTAISSAYEKAFSAIIDSNVTTLITALILFSQASGPVKGFAVTLTAGIIGSMFSALLVTRVLFWWGTDLNWIKKISMMDLMPKRVFNFIGMGRKAILLSIFVILISGGYFLYRGSANFGVDFQGGDLLMLNAKEMISEDAARKVLEAKGISASIQIARSLENEYLSVRASFGDGVKAEQALREAFPEAGFEEGSIESVGPVVGQELATKSVIALLFGMVGIMIYVTLRFEFSFAVGAIVAVVHDVVITLGLFSFFHKELSMVFVGAVLTIAGYSINDTIVVFDRIREGLLGSKRDSVATIMNQAINQTLSRTILTGGTTLVAVLVLMILGGPTLADFGLAIFIGVIVGTYSSIFVAAPIVLWWSKLTGKDVHVEVIQAKELEQSAKT